MTNLPSVIHGPRSQHILDHLPARRRKIGTAYVEGERTALEALNGSWVCTHLFILESVYTSANYRDHLRLAKSRNCAIHACEQRALDKLSDCETAPPVGVLVQPTVSALAELQSIPAHLLIPDRIKDPGNLGTLIRAAAAFGFSCVLTENSVNACNEKMIRSSAGACFQKDVLLAGGAPAGLAEGLRREGVRLLAFDPTAPVSLNQRSMGDDQRIAIVLGSEVEGIDERVWSGIERVRIPILPGVESLNVAVSGAIAMYELTRNRLA